MNPARRNLLLSAPLLLTGCGFALRQAPRFGFRSIYLALPDSSALGLELRRQLQVRAAAAALASFERGWAGQIGLVAVMVRLLLMNS